jgi:hypothetical protein
MQKTLMILFGGLLLTLSGSGQVSYDVSGIPEKLKEGANTVKRFEEISFEVTDIDRAVQKVHTVVTLLNKQAQNALFFYEHTMLYCPTIRKRW